jgi:hypothetical protein
MKSET